MTLCGFFENKTAMIIVLAVLMGLIFIGLVITAIQRISEARRECDEGLRAETAADAAEESARGRSDAAEGVDGANGIADEIARVGAVAPDATAVEAAPISVEPTMPRTIAESKSEMWDEDC